MNKETLIELGTKWFCNEQYISEVMSTEKWSKHGSHLSDGEELFEIFEKEFPNALTDKSKLHGLLMKWLPLRIKYICNEIFDEFEQLGTTVYRCMGLEPHQLESINKRLNEGSVKVSELGIYWSTNKAVDSYNCNDNELERHTFTANIKMSDVNWYETLLSRIDYVNGDCEFEINLKSDAFISTSLVKNT